MNSFLPIAARDKIWGLKAKSYQEVAGNPRRVAVDLLRIFLSRKTPIMLWGPIGARKTRTIESMCMEQDENGKNYQVITIQPSIMDPTVIHGVVYTSLDPESGETIMKRSIPDIAQQVINYGEEGGLTVMFLDEMTTCMPAQQHALLSILTHGQYGDKNLQEYITIAMASNPEGTVSTVNPLGEQVINRGGHIAWYGDVGLFLEEWRSGFGNPDKKPSHDIDWYTTTLIEQDAEKAFRNGRWKPEELVPYDLMEHTERVTTEQAKMVECINDIFSDAPNDIRHYYLIEVTRALMGNEWAEHMSVVCRMESKKLSAQTVIDIVVSTGVDHTWSGDQLRMSLGDSLYVLDNQDLTDDQISTLTEKLMNRVTEGDRSAYLSFWAFASTVPNEGKYGLMHAEILKLYFYGESEVKEGKMMKEHAIPAFVSQDIRDGIKSVLHARRSA